MILGTQTVPYYNGLGRLERTEHFFRVRMPWRRHMYDIFSESLVYVRPQFCIYWYKPARDALVIRIGWSSGIERK